MKFAAPGQCEGQQSVNDFSNDCPHQCHPLCNHCNMLGALMGAFDCCVAVPTGPCQARSKLGLPHKSLFKLLRTLSFILFGMPSSTSSLNKHFLCNPSPCSPSSIPGAQPSPPKMHQMCGESGHGKSGVRLLFCGGRSDVLASKT